MEDDDLIVYNKDTREIIAIIPLIAGKRDAVFKKGYGSVIENCDRKSIYGDGKHIYLARR